MVQVVVEVRIRVGIVVTADRITVNVDLSKIFERHFSCSGVYIYTVNFKKLGSS